jgi:hypothetical protein
MWNWLKSEETKIKEGFLRHVTEWECEAQGLEAKIKVIEGTLVSGVERDVIFMKGRVAELRARITHFKSLL